MGLKKRSAGLERSSQGASIESFGSWAKTYPSLCEFLASTTYEDGSSRECGTLTLGTADGRLRVSLNDKDTNQYCFLTADSLEKALKRACQAIEAGDGDWRESDPEYGKKKGRR
jgi:hypothetical protein